MKIFLFTIFCVLFLGFSFVVEAKDSGICILTIVLTDSRGNEIEKAQIKTFDENFKNEEKWGIDNDKRLSWSEGKKSYKAGTLYCGRFQNLGIRISADGFELYETVITLARGLNSFAIKLKHEGSNEVPTIEQLGNLRGLIEDSNNNGLQNLSVYLISEKGHKIKTFTIDNGYYEFSSIPNGNYTFEVVGTKELASVKVNKLQLTKGETFLDLVLQPKAKKDSIVFEAVCKQSEYLYTRSICNLVKNQDDKEN